MSNDIDVQVWTAFAFRENGPVHEVMGTHRPIQGEFADDIARTLTGEPKPVIALHQGDVGIGKSMAAAVPVALHALATGSRVVFSTFTQNLRHQMVADTDKLNDILALVFEHFGVAMPRPVRIAERKSATGYLSPSRVEVFANALVKHGGRYSAEERMHANAFISWARDPSSVEIAQWFEREDADGKLPMGLNELDFSLTDAETKSDLAVAEDFRESLLAADTADIVVVTHAMMLLNVSLFGRLLKTTTGADREFKTLLVDEAHQLPAMAEHRSSHMTTLSFIDDVRKTAAADGYAELAARLGGAIAAFEAFVREGFDDGVSADVLVTGPSINQFCEMTAPLIEVLREILAHAIKDREFFLFGMVERALVTISPFDTLLHKAGTTDTEYLSIMDDEVVIRFSTERRIRFGMLPRYAAKAINRLWRTSTHAFETIIFMSGTLHGIDKNPDMFCREIGLKLAGDTHRTIIAPVRAPLRHGRIERIVLAPRDPSIHPSRSSPHPDIGSYTNYDHLRYVVSAIQAAALERRDGETRRIAVFLTSQDSLDFVRDGLENLQLGRHVIAQNIGVKAHSLRDRFKNDPGAIWLGLNWEGVNLVDDNGRSLIKTIIIPRIPLRPNDLMLSHAMGSYYASLVNMNRAWRTVIQGVGRAIRHPDDVVDLWMLDPRWPLHNDLVQRLHQPKTVKGNLYERFEDCLPSRLFAPNEIDDRFGTVDPEGLLTRTVCVFRDGALETFRIACDAGEVVTP